MKKFKEWMLSIGLFGGVILASLLVGGFFGLLQIVLVHYFGWYIWGNRITWTLFIALVIYVACKIPWASPKEPE